MGPNEVGRAPCKEDTPREGQAGGCTRQMGALRARPWPLVRQCITLAGACWKNGRVRDSRAMRHEHANALLVYRRPGWPVHSHGRRGSQPTGAGGATTQLRSAAARPAALLLALAAAAAAAAAAAIGLRQEHGVQPRRQAMCRVGRCCCCSRRCCRCGHGRRQGEGRPSRGAAAGALLARGCCGRVHGLHRLDLCHVSRHCCVHGSLHGAAEGTQRAHSGLGSGPCIREWFACCSCRM